MGTEKDVAPSLASVRSVVDLYFGTDAEEAKCRAKLAEWGNAALPVLKRLFDSAEGKGRREWHILCCIKEIETLESEALLVDILAEAPLDEHSHVLGCFISVPHEKDKGVCERLAGNEKFKQGVLRFAAGGDWLARGMAADIIAALKWFEGEQLIRAMLNGEELSLRTQAAIALEILTGEKVSVRRPEFSFPSISPNPVEPALLGELPKSGWMTPSAGFDRWFDGTPGLIQWRKGWLRLFGPDLGQLAALPIEKMVHDFRFAPSPRGGRQMIALVSDGRQPTADYVASFDLNGKLLWADSSERSGVSSMTPLYGEDGAVRGVAVLYRGDEGIVGLNLAGKRLWNLPGVYVDYRLDSSPAFPARLLHCGGGLELIDTAGERIAKPSAMADLEMYANDALIISDGPESPRIAVIAAGTTPGGGVPMITKFSESLRAEWSATLPHQVHDLASLGNQPGSLIAATTYGGELLLFDGEGTLLHRSSFIATAGNDVSLYGLNSGTWEDGTIGICVGTLKGLQVYRISPHGNSPA